MSYFVYIMASESRALYTGVTNDIERRVSEHQKSIDDVILSGAKDPSEQRAGNLSESRRPSFSSRYKTRNLVYFETFGDIRAAIAREKQIKGWVRSKKLALVRSMNPNWNDLSAEWRKGTANAKPNAPTNVIPNPLGAVILSGAKNLSPTASSAPPTSTTKEEPKGKRDSSPQKPGLRMTPGA